MEQNVARAKLNDKGLSLVELLVAISIGVIVAGSIAALMIFSIRMYRNESANTQMQYELQSNLNMMMDEIMASQTLVVDQNAVPETTEGAPYTKYALFGTVKSTGFSGVIFVSSGADTNHRFKVYMDRFTDPSTDVKTVATNAYNRVKGHFTDDPNPYLLGQNVTRFVIKPDPDGNCMGVDPKDSSRYIYTNPVRVKVELNFEQNGWGDKKYNKHVADEAYMRNKLTSPIYVGTSGTFTEYTLKLKEE